MSISTKHVLITGGAGYIGSAIARLLIDEGHAVVVYDDLSTGRQEVLDPSVVFIGGDILDLQSLEEVFKTHTFDAVIHCAAKKVMNESEQDPTTYFENNVGGTLNLLSCMERYQVPRIIFSSTAAVYAPISETRGVIENDMVDPVSVYGRSKLMAEMLITEYVRLKKIQKYTILRYFNVAGDIGLNFMERNPQGVFPLLAQAFKESAPFNVFGTTYPTRDGSGVRDYIHLSDLSRAHVCALASDSSAILNLGTSNGYTVYELIEAFKGVTHKELEVISQPPRAGDVAVMYADASKAEEILGWKPEKSLSDMVQSTCVLYGI